MCDSSQLYLRRANQLLLDLEAGSEVRISYAD